MTPESELRDVVLKVRYPGMPGRDDLATSIGDSMLFVSMEHGSHKLDDIALTVEFPGLLAPVALSARIVVRVAGNPAAGQASGVYLRLLAATDAEREGLASLLDRLRGTNAPPPTRDSPFRLLLVDDSELVHKVITSAVARMQRAYTMRVVEVLNATSVDAALELLAHERVDMALVDHWMPQRTGDELIRTIRASPTHRALPILVVTEGGPQTRDTMLRAGADLVLDKPLMLKPLLTTITALVTSLPVPPGAQP